MFQHNDVYPGRLATSYDPNVDHNCNGIYGGNATASYEDLFCKDSQPRGLIMLGDSATAHFHIPPQWLTADGWNFDQFLPDAENELDQPHCSWGTGHVTPEECPFQNPVPGVDNQVISLYTQLRARNRCNHNDFQNIGVNGARITSSMKLVDAMGRSQTMDKPALVWLSLIGNDVCNGHPGFDHMTTPDEFYTSAMQTLNAIDNIVPAGSYLVALAMFDGELLYNTMHALQHPVGTTYSAFYDMMNCEEENPCWGWLNSDAVVRANTTKISNSLNDVWQNISDTASFKNFEFIYYSPNWVTLFSDYAAAGYPLSNLIGKPPLCAQSALPMLYRANNTSPNGHHRAHRRVPPQPGRQRALRAEVLAVA
jgi:acyloxyacyl hydrolase